MKAGKRWCLGVGFFHLEEGGCAQRLCLERDVKEWHRIKVRLGCKAPQEEGSYSGSGCVSSVKFTVTHTAGVASKLSAF